MMVKMYSHIWGNKLIKCQKTFVSPLIIEVDINGSLELCHELGFRFYMIMPKNVKTWTGVDI